MSEAKQRNDDPQHSVVRFQFEDQYPAHFGIYYSELSDGYHSEFDWCVTQCMLQNARWDAWKVAHKLYQTGI